jgi:hypothetical protein
MSQSSIIHQENIAPSREKLLQMLTGQYLTQAISVVAKLGIADLLQDGAKSNDELAKLTGVNAQFLYRIMRALASGGVFVEIDNSYFKINSLAKYLQSDFTESIRDVAILEGAQWLWQGWGNMFDAVKTGVSGFESHFEMPVIEYLKQNPEQIQMFKAALKTYSTIITNAVLDAYDFSETSKLVDVGGGFGDLLFAILKANSSITGVLFDLPSTIDRAQESNNLPSELSGRSEMVGGDFFESVPSGGNIYILKQIIHNWNDEQAIEILKNCYQAMPIDGKLLVIDPIISPHEQSFNTFLDLQFLIVSSGSRLRTENEFRELFTKAGFQLIKIVTTQSTCSIIEGLKIDNPLAIQSKTEEIMTVKILKNPDDRYSQKIATPILDRDWQQEYIHKFLWQGFFTFVLGCVIPIFMSLYINPRAGLAGHSLGVMMGIFIICAGLAIPHTQLSKRLVGLTFWLFVVSGYTGLTIQVLAALFGLTQSFPITGKGYLGGPLWMEIFATVASRLISLLTLLGCFIFLYGLRKIKVDSSSASSKK